MRLYNTYKKSIEEIKTIEDKKIGLYSCGPTVYSFQHIGNMRYFLFVDILKRSLEYLGYEINHIMNITDVGHLTSDEDEGDDKMEKGAKNENLTVWEVAQKFTDAFLVDIKKLNIKEAKFVKATEHIDAMLELISYLSQNGYTYTTEQAIYFDITKFSDYENISGQKLSEKSIAVRDEVFVDSQKKNPADFALWFFTVGRFSNHTMRWQSEWGEGFPGWHIECSAMSKLYLGQPFDIHTGGVDHISVHHANEISQSYCAYGKELANYWVHSEHLVVNNRKMSKSLGNIYLLSDLEEKGFLPLDFRYFCLTAHYSTKINFTFEGLESSANALKKLKNEIEILGSPTNIDETYNIKFRNSIENNLNLPQSLSILWEVLNDKNLDNGTKRATINEFDKVLGLNLSQIKKLDIPENLQNIIEERNKAREEKNWDLSDKLRKEIEDMGYEVLDTAEGTKIR